MSTILLATGGTGGHIYPAVAVARELRARGHEVAVVGQQGGMEARLVPAEGLPFYGVRAGKWDRGRPDPRQALRAGRGLLEAVKLLRALSPDLVVGFGGFASFPGVAAARWLRIPFMLHGPDAFPGLVTRIFARHAALVTIADEATGAHLPRAKRLALVGQPVREARVEKRLARKKLGLPEAGLLTLVTGGSQGSAVLNAQVPEAFRRLSQGGEPEAVPHTVLHGSGERWAEAVRGEVGDLPGYHVTPYFDATLAWSAADLAITRAGVTTLAEAAFHGVPLLVVPLPGSADDHQLHNARAVEAAGAGAVVQERELHALPERWRSLLRDEVRCPAGEAARARSPAGAASRFADLIGEVVSGTDPYGPRTSPPESGRAAQETL